MYVTKDFKMVVVIDEKLPAGLQCNTAAVLPLTLGKKIDGLIDKDIKDASGNIHIGLTNQPLPILKSTGEIIESIREKAQSEMDILVIDVTDAAQTTKNYDDYEYLLKSKKTNELKYLGVALAGSEQTIKKFTGNLGLLR
jgi:hypothetical protein